MIAAGIGAAGSITTAAIGAASGAGKIDPKSIQPYGNIGYGNYNLNDPFKGAGSPFYKLGQDAQGRGDINWDPYAMEQQKALVAQLQQQAAGNGPSAAQGVLRQGTDEAIKSAMALAGSARGAGIGGAQLQAINSGTNATMAGANQATMLRAQEQQSAIQQLGQVLGGMRTAGYNEALASQNRRDQLEQFYMSLGLSREQAQLQAGLQEEQDKLNAWNSYENRKAGVAGQNAQRDMNMVAGLGQGFSALGAAGTSMLGSLAKNPPAPQPGGGGSGGGGGGSGGGGGGYNGYY